MKIEQVSISTIKLNEENPRHIQDANFQKLVRSIKEFPEMLNIRPIVVDENMTALGGNMRLKACREAGLTEVPVIQAKNLTKEQQKEFIIKDNVGFGEWDWEILKADWDVEELSEWGLDMPDIKFDTNEAEEDNYEIPDQLETDIEEGDLIQIGPHRVLCGSSTNVENWRRLMGEERFDVINTDPPYNVDYTGKTKDALKIQNDKMNDGDFFNFLFDFYSSIAEVTKKGAPWYIWHADSEGHNFRKAMIDAGIMVKQCLVWVKNTIVMGRQDYHWKHEPCLYGWMEGSAHTWYSDRKQSTVLEFDRPTRNTEHPTMKPIPLIAYQLKNSSKEGDLVGDGFLGSGTTMVAAHQLKRKCYGMELDPKYCQVVVDRMKELDPDLEVKITKHVS